MRHVAEQIDDLYWKRDDDAEGATREDDVLRRGVDLRDPQYVPSVALDLDSSPSSPVYNAFTPTNLYCRNVEALPESFPAENGDSEEDLEQLVHQSLGLLEFIRLLTGDRYQTLKAQLSNLSVAVQAQRQRRAYYAKLKSLIEPFENPQESVQPNLVTKDSQLATELEHTRILAAKLAYQIEKAKFSSANRMEEDESVNESAEDQLRKILDQAK